MFNSTLTRISAALNVLFYGPPTAAIQLKPAKDERGEMHDPLDMLARARIRRADSIEDGEKKFELRSALDDVVKTERAHGKKILMDSAEKLRTYVGDDSAGNATLKAQQGFYGMPQAMQDWYMSQSFIGWQACAIIAQQWLINKACSQSGLDAVRHGWEINVADGTSVDSSILDQIDDIDEEFKIKKHCSDLSKFTNVFGVRICIYVVKSDDPKYYEKPFNIDGVMKGSYKGIRQVDPYWCAPMLDSESASDPTSLGFYEPTYWVVGGRKYHKSHLHIGMGPEVADILKPVYYYGGLPLTQRIYERIYAAERTANEAPLLSMSKRTTALHVDLKKLASNQRDFEARLADWIAYRDNHAVKVLGLEEVMEESDTSLADLDSVTMNQYQLVAAISETPATKLLGTSPKGFNATGEFEEKSYHEKLETIQSDEYTPFLVRHYKLLCKSMGWDFRIEISWNPTDAKTAEAQAEINKNKVDTGVALINAGVISPDEERQRIRDDKLSGYTGIDDAGADTGLLNPGELEHPGAEEKGEAAVQTAEGAEPANPTSKPAPAFGEGDTTVFEEAEVAGFPHTPVGQVISTAGPSPEDVKALAAAMNRTLSLMKAPGSPSDMTPGGEKLTPVNVKPSVNNVRSIKPGVVPEGGVTGESRHQTELNQSAAMTAMLNDLAGVLDEVSVIISNRVATPEVVDTMQQLRTAFERMLGDVSGHAAAAPDVQERPNPHMAQYTADADEGIVFTKWRGYDIGIENYKGDIREGEDLNGNKFKSKMAADYGYFKGISGADGDSLDVFVGPNDSKYAYIINQNNPETGEFDEHKVIINAIGYPAAKKIYDDSFSDDWKGFDSIHELGLADFHQWMKEGDKSIPFSPDWQIQGQTANSPVPPTTVGDEIKHDPKTGQFTAGGGSAGGEKAKPAKPVKPEKIKVTSEKVSKSSAEYWLTQIQPSKGTAHQRDEIEQALMSGAPTKLIAKDPQDRLVGAIAFGEAQSLKGGIEIHHVGSVEKGAGTNLVKKVQAAAKRAGEHVILYSHPDAKGFYEKLGFKESPDAENLMRWDPPSK